MFLNYCLQLKKRSMSIPLNERPYPQRRSMQPGQQIRTGPPSQLLASKHVNKNMGLKNAIMGIHTHDLTLKCAKTGISSNQMGTSLSHGDINKRQINHDRSRISVRWSKWFKEARTADHSFSSISFQRLTKIARHFKLLSVPHSECAASIASKL